MDRNVVDLVSVGGAALFAGTQWPTFHGVPVKGLAIERSGVLPDRRRPSPSRRCAVFSYGRTTFLSSTDDGNLCSPR
jgi:hypothetical protein